MKKTVLLCMACALLVSACTTPGKKTAWGAAGGAAVGAAAGAIIANNTGGKSEKGAIYGALAGMAAGGLLGNYYDKQAKELAKIAEVVKSDNGIQVYLKNDILFTTGSSELSASSMQTLTDLNKVLKKYPKNRIVVQGYTDSTGSDAINNKLSTQRAKAVYDFLLGSGLKTQSITYVGYGSSNPIASNATAAGRAQNRRVVLSITANEKDLK
ncbi:OmpA family protein [Candidatus Avelusimicrobium alvi]|mgnify:FL=1|uniref:OmpA family protein n=1 Tax=Candidatus Avelusimicrobium alvi TaxID=3416221 RepID=UPI003D0B3703